MAADALHIVLGIGNKHCQVIRIGTVGRIGQPEILPDHDAISVAGIIQFFVANHAYPVAKHGEVHVCMISHGSLVFAAPVIQVRLTEAPVTTTANETATVDVEVQHVVLLVERHLTNTDFEVTGIGYFVIYFERKVCII